MRFRHRGCQWVFAGLSAYGVGLGALFPGVSAYAAETRVSPSPTPATAMFRFEIEPSEKNATVKLTGTADYGLILSPGFMFKQLIQQILNQQVKCDQDGSYSCQEYPVGRLVGDQKLLMIQDETTKEWRHAFRFEYQDLGRNKRLVEFPVEIGRQFPKAAITNFKLLDPDKPGAFRQEFTVTPQTFGDSLVKLVPETNRLYGHLCQVFPGTSLLNNSFRAKYTYVGFLGLTLDVSGKLGGVQFDALRFCSLVKVETTADNQVLSTVIDVIPPVTYNLKRVPLEVRVSPSSWLAVVIVILVIGILLAFLPVLFLKVLGIILIVIGVLATVLGLLSSQILTTLGNKMVDQEIRRHIGMELSGFNSDTWTETIRYSKDLESIIRQQTENADGSPKVDLAGQFKDGSWAATFLTFGLLKDQHLLGQASATVTFEHYFRQFNAGKERIRESCREAIARVASAKIPAEIEPLFQQIRDELNRVCDAVTQVNLTSQLFRPLEVSRGAGCYDAFVRLEDVQGSKEDLIRYLLGRLESGGGVYRDEVIRVLKERLAKLNTEEFEFVRITNWWADQSAPAYCGFDNELQIQLPKLTESRLIGCFLAEAMRHPREDTLAEGLLKNCGPQIAGLVDLDALIRRLGLKPDELRDLARRMEMELPELREKAGPILKELEPALEKLILELKRKAAGL